MGKKIFYHLFKANVIKPKLNVFKRVIISLIIIIFVPTILNNIKAFIFNNLSEINIVIQGNSNQRIISSYYKGGVSPSEILVNGVKDNSCTNNICNLNKNKNNITLRFNEPIQSLREIFRGLTNILEADLSKFDSSELTDMMRIFYDCSNLQKINFGNIDTSNVVYMRSLFKGCSSLTSLDLSKFDTSKIDSFYQMFCDCSNLKYLDLSNFDTSKVETIYKMFENCKSLIFLNLKSFKLPSNVEKTNSFKGISTFGQYCIQDSTLLNYLSGKIKSNCTHECFQKSIKIDINNNRCINSCINKKYEINNICHNECPLDSYPLFYEEEIHCSNSLPQGYYFDNNDKMYKKCFENCLECFGPGNEINNKCSKCKNNFIFLNEYINDDIKKNNCFQKCEYYYYIDSNKYYCTQNNKCPNKYSKIIPNKFKCIDDCKLDNIHQYEFNNTCFEKCPFGTSYNNSNYICQKKEEMEIKNEFLKNIQENIKNGFNTEDIDKGNESIFIRDNIIFIITSTKNQENNKNNANVTTIDLGDCEKDLKHEYNISLNDSFYIFKIDAKINHMNKLEYEVYYPFSLNDFTKLDLSICSKKNIFIYIPADISLNDINKYNQSSEIYNDVCYSSKDSSGADKPLNIDKMIM